MSTITVKMESPRLKISLEPQASRMTSADYDMTDEEPRFNPDVDDTISIRCPDKADGSTRLFQMQRSAMMRSPTLLNFFRSPHYLPNCEMLLTFFADPAACFEIVKRYLEDGPDHYSKNDIRIYVTLHYKIVDRFIILTRLYKFAKALCLPLLTEMAYGVLLEMERLITADRIITITGLIFGQTAGFDKTMKEWCMKHVAIHFAKLLVNTQWEVVVKKSDPQLIENWAELVDNNDQIYQAVVAEIEDKAIEDMLKQQGSTRQHGSVSALEETFKEKTREEQIADARKVTPATSESDWEDLEGAAGDEGQKTTDAKARTFLGIEGGKMHGSSSMEPPRPSNVETAKARAVMGIDGDSGPVVGGHKKSGLKREKLMKLLR